MRKSVRIVARPTIDNPDSVPLFLDVVIDSQGKITSDSPIFAFQGDLGKRYGRSLPFVVLSDGRIDFGEHYDISDRFGELDLRDGTVELERLLHLRGTGYQEAFRISEITPLCDD